jgi:hypothetical protein
MILFKAKCIHPLQQRRTLPFTVASQTTPWEPLQLISILLILALQGPSNGRPDV